LADLESPESPDDLYRYRGSELNVARPIFQGDVFSDIEIPGLEDGRDLAMVLTHPCTMRGKGGVLRDRLLVCRVSAYRKVSVPWTGEYAILPLPDLVEGSATAYAAHFEDVGQIKSSELDALRRIACLDDRGVLLLQQRHAHHFTRHAVETETLFEHTSGLLVEAELLEEWIDAAVPLDPADDWQARCAAATKDFDEFLDPHRQKLTRLADHAWVRRLVLAEVKQRFEA
jgi:hypothetical protein